MKGALQKLNHRVYLILKDRLQHFLKRWVDAFNASPSPDTSAIVPFLSLELTIERDQMVLSPPLSSVRDTWTRSLQHCFAVALNQPQLKDPRFHLASAAPALTTFSSIFDVLFALDLLNGMTKAGY